MLIFQNLHHDGSQKGTFRAYDGLEPLLGYTKSTPALYPLYTKSYSSKGYDSYDYL